MTSPDQNYTSWHVGMKVVCVDAHGRWGPVTATLHEGAIYTVKDIFTLPEGVVCVDLVEIARDAWSHVVHGCRVGYGAFRFRPVQTRKTDISIFTAMLNPKPAKAGKVRA